ncbi:matrix-remodeling-associated protein 5-like [Euwallacea fornicatus]|uniref:matrix-remodeling-associated protein 5-like n=1 Tax=Euwallacea fornicatus TaxID=995702 RepID=UPI00338E0C09
MVSQAVRILWAVFLWSVGPSVEARQIEIPCPEFCACDLYLNMKRALCQNKKLVSIELGLPSQAEILDVGQNQISELTDKTFLELGLTNLKLLNLSHNAIRQIHFNAFAGMENLKTLDLSYNAIEYFTDSWFRSLPGLEELYLKGNKLRSINEEPLINIENLKVLDISSCGITTLKSNTFKLIPNLKILDISDNYIKTMQVDLLESLPKLTIFKTHGNDFNCKDPNMITVGSYVKIREILYSDACSADVPTSFTINHSVHQFEKMIMSEKTTPAGEEPARNSWIFEQETRNIESEDVKCENVKTIVKESQSLLLEVIQLSPWISVSVIFVYGVLCGMVLTCCINICAKKKSRFKLKDSHFPDGSVQRRKLKRSNSAIYRTLQKVRLSRFHQEFEDEDSDVDTLVMNQVDLPNSTPVVTRKATL